MMDATFLSLVALGVGVATWLVSVAVSFWRGDANALDGMGDDETDLGRTRTEPMVLSYQQERHFHNGDL